MKRNDPTNRRDHTKATPHKPITSCHLDMLSNDQLLVYLNAAFADKPDIADFFAEVFYCNYRAMEHRNMEEKKRALDVTGRILDLIYEFGTTHQAGADLHQAYIAGYLRPEDEPRQLISAAILRGKSSVGSPQTPIRSTKNKRTKKK
jgi:hypothetical protein